MDEFIGGVKSVATGGGLGFALIFFAILVLLAFFGWGPMRIADEIEKLIGGGS